jgi:hypothetical protein
MRITLLFGISLHSSGAKGKAIPGGYRVQKKYRSCHKLQTASSVTVSLESAHLKSNMT